jgi:acetyl-CoA carboxylase biotin carboxyl carrier protein
MNMKEVKDLIQEILQSDITEFELEHTGTRVKLKRGMKSPEVAQLSLTPPPAAPSHPSLSAPPEPSPPAIKHEELSDNGLHLITSPIVGTFFRAPSPGAEPYVKVGDVVEEGSILCVVEAMKLMNEIPADVPGEVVQIYVENSQPVEFGQRLFGLRPRS